MEPKVINIARDFSRYPVGRYDTDGPYSGQAFRNKFLLPAFNSAHNLIVEFDGARGYGSSFLEEAFGGLVRAGIDANEVLKRIEFRSSDKTILEEINSYVRDAGLAAMQVAKQ
jgi:hypothetical protein